MKKLIKYIIRWQLSTPILAIIPAILLDYGISSFFVTAIISNFVGSLIFFKVYEIIFSKETRFSRLRNRVLERKNNI